MSSPFQSCPASNTAQAKVQQRKLQQSVCSASLVSKIPPKGVSSAVFLKSNMWPKHQELLIKFVDGEPWRKAWVEKVVMENLQPHVGLTLNFTDSSNEAHITVSFASARASSLIGKDSIQDVPSMYLGWVDPPHGSFEWKGETYAVPEDEHRNSGFDNGATVIHEFGHALGMLHEHQNPRGKPIIWNDENVWDTFCGPPNKWDWATIQHNVIDALDINTTNGSNFDPQSVMIYGFPGALTKNMPNGIQPNPNLSRGDTNWLRKTYPKEGSVWLSESYAMEPAFDIDLRNYIALNILVVIGFIIIYKVCFVE